MIKVTYGLALYGLLMSSATFADNFGSVRYVAKSDELVVTMIYSGTNPDHDFSVQWGSCKSGEGQNEVEIAGEVLDGQFQDAARRSYKKTVRFGLGGLPCRPTKVTLRTAPRFYYTLTLPKVAGAGQ